MATSDQQSTSDIEQQVGEGEQSSPWGSIGFGLLLIAVGVGGFFWFAHLESEGGRIRTHALIILAYTFLGKWGVLGVFGGLGVITTGLGIRGLLAGNSSTS